MLLRLSSLLAIATACGAVVHYDVTLTADPAAGVLRGRETIRIPPGSPARVLRQGAELTIGRGGSIEVAASRSPQRLSFEYTVRASRGFRWLEGGAGFFSAFYCEAWMVCDNEPAGRATLRLEVIVPAGTGWTVAGPGVLRRRWRAGSNEHFLFEQREPVQTYLFSFGAARLTKYDQGESTVYATQADQAAVFTRTREAYAFLRSKAGADPIANRYAQVFLPGVNPGQEAAGLALMGEKYRARLAGEDDVALLAHEAAHQWWGVLVGIRSWSDFWLNEGFAEFLTAAYIEHHRGREAYDAMLAELRSDLERWNKSIKSECIRPGVPLSLEDARRLVEQYIRVYNEERLHSGIGYVTPPAVIEGRREAIQAERDQKLEQARLKRGQQTAGAALPERSKSESLSQNEAA